jgi:polyisoprenoid-binding protein YceI
MADRASAGLIATAMAFVTLTGHPAKAESYVFDGRRTEVRFAYQIGWTKQQGRFTGVEGTLQFDKGAPERSHVTAKVATASLETGQPIIDAALKSSDFFNVVAQPEIRFKSRAVKPTGAGRAEMTGDITVNGITKPITFDVSLQPHNDPALKWSPGSMEFLAAGRIRHSTFAMTSFAYMVGDDVEIVIDAVAHKTR